MNLFVAVSEGEIQALPR